MQKKKLLTGDEFTCDNLPECWQYPLKSGKFKIIDLQEMNGETFYRLRTDNGHFYNLIDLSGVQTLQKEKGVWVLARYLEKVEKKTNLIESIEKNQNEIFKDFENGDNKKMAKYKINDKVTKVNLEMFNPLFKKKVELNGGKMPPLKIIGIRSSDDGNYTDYIVSLSKEPAQGGISSVAIEENPETGVLVNGSLSSMFTVIEVSPTFGVFDLVICTCGILITLRLAVFDIFGSAIEKFILMTQADPAL